MKPVDPNATLLRKVAISSFVGTAIEWYDFFIFNAATALLIFPKLFFPGADPTTDILKSLSVYAVGFVARPIGGMVCGHFGDRAGRKSMLVLTLLLTGFATLLIGLLPTYQEIGAWAPALLVLLRFAQGFAIGGEWGGAVLMAVEHAPSHKRGLYGGWPQVGVPVGLFLSNVIFFGLIANLPESVRLSGWWRAPFLLSGLLVGLGVYIRLSLAESPAFDAIKKTPSRMPILDVWRWHHRDVLLAMGAKVAENGIFYLYTVFVVTFAMKRGFPVTSVFIAISLASLMAIVAIPIFSMLSDQFGRRKIYLFGAIFSGIFALPSFLMIETGRTILITLAIVLALVLGWAAMYAPQASFFSEMFETRVRYSGASLGAQVATIFSGGLMQVVAVDLFNRTDNYWPVLLILVGMTAITTVSVFLATETFRKDIGGLRPDQTGEAVRFHGKSSSTVAGARASTSSLRARRL
jgi:MFS transporter, MHS family, shikimate and dehydroshikimate transport protein